METSSTINYEAYANLASLTRFYSLFPNSQSPSICLDTDPAREDVIAYFEAVKMYKALTTGSADFKGKFQYSKNFIISEDDLRAAHYDLKEELTEQDVEKLAQGLERLFPNLALCKGSKRKETRQCISNPLAFLSVNKTSQLIAQEVNHFLRTRYPDFHRRVYLKNSQQSPNR